MITNSSKNNLFICTQELCDDPINRCLECIAPVQEKVHPVKGFLRDLWLHFLLFIGTDRWGDMLSLKAGDSHYNMRMDDIQNRWRHM